MLAGCSHSAPPGGVNVGGGGGSDLAVAPSDGGAGNDQSGGGGDPDMAPQLLDVEPAALQTLTITSGQPMPTVLYTATYGGNLVNVAWSIDRGDIGSVGTGPAQTTTFTPTGNVAGLVNVTAGLNGVTIKRQIQINIATTQNGPSAGQADGGQMAPADMGTLNSGGGVGGVGGEGLGGAVTDPGTTSALGAPVDDGSTFGLKWLYPYDGTVFPRGLLAPLLMWSWSTGDADAIQISLKTTSGAFSWTGQFAAPAALAQESPAGKFVRMPIPQDIWQQATDSAGGAEKLTVSLTVAKGGMAHGPISQTWTIAPGRVSGIIYYNSYGTNLAQNSGGDKSVGTKTQFGGAVLSIHVGDTAPKLVAGTSTGTSNSGCRVCHSVSADGSRLMVQHGDVYGNSSIYDLTASTITEHNPVGTSSTFPGFYPDGSMAISSTTALLPMPDDTTTVTPTGLSVFGGNIGAPAFSPDKTMLVFNPMSWTGNTKPSQKLLVSTFDAATNTFGTPVVVADDSAQAAGVRPGWPAFLPDSKSIVFHHQSVQGVDGLSGQLYTRKGAKAQIAWTGINAANVTPLKQLNGLNSQGTSYLPTFPAGVNMSCLTDGTSEEGTTDVMHTDDVDYNYEPTVAPIAAGGYAWVVFTSRRMYGNEATMPPYCSDPRAVDLIKNITTKKLWVAAVDLNATPDGTTDPSHPAFYLPAQELLAGNSRGFWVLDPCRADGVSCQSGDQCCNGFCEPNGAGGALVCSDTPPVSQCSQVSEKCSTAADCCDPANLCINGFCSVPPIS